MNRCTWTGEDELYTRYHDEEWGVPQHDDQKLFEMLNLEGAQAGLSWITILRKRENYQEAFDQFDPSKIVKYGEEKVAELLTNPGIVRNRLKIRAVISNAEAYFRVCSEFGNFDNYIWQFVDHVSIINQWQKMAEVPAKTDVSDAMSKDLKKRGFKFVGSTICYAYMQAVGMVNDHTVDCFRWKACC